MKILISAICIFITTTTFATNYYIDATNGNDANSGTTLKNAWQSINKVNNAKLQSGDSVLFKRGDIFRGYLLPISGSSSGSVTYAAYGTGIKPRLYGSIIKDSVSDWTSEGGNIWHTLKQTMTTRGEEILNNPDFNDDLTSWQEYHNTANAAAVTFSRTTERGSYYTSPGGGKFTCLNHGMTYSDIQLYTGKCTIKSSKYYKLQFKAKASQPFTIPSHGINILQNIAPYTPYSSSSKAIEITTSWATYELYYKTIATTNNARIDFYLGNVIPNGAIFYFDSLSFKELDNDPIFIIDVGNIIFNNDAYCGMKVKNEKDLNAQGKFWHDKDNLTLKIYSVSNPAVFYSNIEIAFTKNIINGNNTSYITYQNLDLRYGAAHGIGGANTNHILIKDVDFSYIGGGFLIGYGDGKVRFGNGVEFWGKAHDNLVERCSFNQIYDAALTAQGIEVGGYEAYNIYFRNNIIRDCEYSFELWGRGPDSYLHDIYFENNTCLLAGFGWGHVQRPDPNGTHLILWSFTAQSKNIYVINNVFYESSDWGLRGNISELSKIICDYNCWYESSGPISKIENSNFDFATQWSDYKSISRQDMHSIAADPILLPNFAPAKNSPCIGSGTIIISDTNANKSSYQSQITKINIGAF